MALAVRQDSREANSSHVVVPSENDAENPEMHVPSSDDPGSLTLPLKRQKKKLIMPIASCCNFIVAKRTAVIQYKPVKYKKSPHSNH